MTEKSLVERLRQYVTPIRNEAADRIEALEASLREIADDCNPGGDGNLLRAKAHRALKSVQT